MKLRRAYPSVRQSTRAYPGKSGNPKERYEQYVTLARNAASNGEEVGSENYYQHAEHYFRPMRAS
jgi:hypothetical protein